MKFYLGDPGFQKTMRKIYSWLVPGFCCGMSILLLLSGGWIPSLLFLCVTLLYLPMLKDFWARFWLKGFLKAILALAMVIGAIYSTGLYV